MNAKFGLLSVLTLLLVATTAEASLTIAGEFSGAVDYLSGAPEFFQTTSVAGADRVVGSITLNATDTKPLGGGVVGYTGSAVYRLSLYDLENRLLQSFSGTGTDAYFNVSDGSGTGAAASGFGISSITGGTWGGRYYFSAFSVSDTAADPARFQLAFQSAGGKKPGSVQGSLTVAPMVTFAEPLPTPVPAALPLFASGLAGLGCLWRRSFTS